MLMKKAINILGVPVTRFSMEEAVSFLMDRIAKPMWFWQMGRERSGRAAP